MRTERSAWTAALVLAGVMTVGGCSGPHSQPQRTTAAPSAGASVAEMQKFASVTLPAGASGVQVTPQKSPQGTKQYRVVFTTSESGANAFCSGNQLGGSLVQARGLDRATRKKFGVTGDSKEKPRTCASVVNGETSVQRDVLVTFPGGDKAKVYLLAYEMP